MLKVFIIQQKMVSVLTVLYALLAVGC